MADNYLEKQYELYQGRKAEWEKKKKLGKRKSLHTSSTGKGTQPADGTSSQSDKQADHD